MHFVELNQISFSFFFFHINTAVGVLLNDVLVLDLHSTEVHVRREFETIRIRVPCLLKPGELRQSEPEHC